jgi:hypothetical protein
MARVSEPSDLFEDFWEDALDFPFTFSAEVELLGRLFIKSETVLVRFFFRNRSPYRSMNL